MLRSLAVLLSAALALSGLPACQQKYTKNSATHTRDGVLGITETNPNMPLSASFRTYPDDLRVMQNAIGQRFPNVSIASISLNGPTAYVRLTAPAHTPPEEIERIRQGATEALAAAAPRYNANVTVIAK
ncbi:hypothetical protein YDYSG_10660 [Paenibacillus tyrfis]|uniref:hypothetical protein n=1 Tax=Paenibacillus tyrfis TaxID=1501230 RepID=UPI0024934ED8|nr:hypothetical protein [Paenibacillus tyrfis]GLI05036.1 hypothetical protein YDYSG_10660 [Paenibacillus tyrfis]